MKITFNKKLVDGPWGGGNQFLRLFLEYLQNGNIQSSFTLDKDTDVVFILDSKDSSSTFSYDDVVQFKKSNDIELILRVNDNASHRNIQNDTRDDLMIKYSRISDKVIFISQWIKNYFMLRGISAAMPFVINNACDRNLFNSDNHIRRPHDPLKIVCHHWSSNLSKGYDCYEALSKFCKDNANIANFTFIGQAPKDYLNDCNRIPPQKYEDIPKYLRNQDIYISATKNESGGYHVVEGMASGLIPFIREGSGGPLNYAYDYCVSFENEEDMVYKIKGLYNNYGMYQYLNNKIKEYTYSSEDMCNKYLEAILQ